MPVTPVVPNWRAVELPPAVATAQTMLMPTELQLLYGLARDHFLNVGHIVDAGCFLGGSTRALGHGAMANPLWLRTPRPGIVWSYDLFVVEPWTIGVYFPEGTPLGMSFEEYHRRNTAALGDLVVVQAGDVTGSALPPNPIEILFIDLAKHWTVSDHLVRRFFPRLIPGHSIVIQQDYLYQAGTGWLPVTMELFSDHFDLVDHTELNSVVFHYKRAIPPALLERDPIASLTRTEILDLSNRAIARFGGRQREILVQARDDFQASLAALSWPL